MAAARLTTVLVLLALPVYANASPDGGTWDVELLDAGTILPSQAACMPPGDAQTLDEYLRATEADSKAYRAVALVAVPVGGLAVVTAVVLGIVLAGKK
jgi:hypothetical protein